MRRIFDQNGSDVTTTVQGYLAAGQSFVFADLYRFQTVDFINPNPTGRLVSWTYTDAAFPIFINQCQLGWLPGSYVPNLRNVDLNFLPEVISHSDFTFEVGFNSNPVQITWAIDETKSYGPWYFNGTSTVISPISGCTYPSNLTLKQALLLGLFDMVPFWIHRAIFYPDFPTRGGALVGTTLMHRGYLSAAVGTTENVKLKIDSLMQVLRDTQVPVQTLMPNSRSMLFVPTVAAPFGGDFSSPTPVSPLVISVHTSEAVTASALADCWLSFCPGGGALQNFVGGNPLPPLYRIRDNTAVSGGSVTIYLYKPYVLGQSPSVKVYGQSQFDNTEGAPGFPSVPAAEASFGGVVNPQQNQGP